MGLGPCRHSATAGDDVWTPKWNPPLPPTPPSPTPLTTSTPLSSPASSLASSLAPPLSSQLLYKQCALQLFEGGGADSRAERRALRKSAAAPLPELHTDASFDPEQIWLQVRVWGVGVGVGGRCGCGCGWVWGKGKR